VAASPSSDRQRAKCDNGAVTSPRPLQQCTIAAFLGGPGVEGGLEGPDQPGSSWQAAVVAGLVEPVGTGLSFFSDPGPLIELVGSSGIHEVFLRIQWARIASRPGHVDGDVLDRYAEIVRHLRAVGVAVNVSLCEGPAPAWLGTEAWLRPGTPQHFSAYADAVLESMGHAIDAVITFEEPSTWALAGWVLGAVPPFRRGALADAVAATDAMVAAHVLVAASSLVQERSLEVSMVERGWKRGSNLEQLVLGDSPRSGFARRLHAWSPGAARRAWIEAALPAPPCSLAIGRGPRPRGVAGSILDRTFGSDELLSSEAVVDEVVAMSRGTESTLVVRAVVTQLDRHGRRRDLAGPRRLRELGVMNDAIAGVQRRGIDVRRLIVGEFTDRWTLGTYDHREGLVGVDRTSEGGAPQLLSTDASGVDALGAVRDLFGLA
jgi:Glycosyl hydrolase family 1